MIRTIYKKYLENGSIVTARCTFERSLEDGHYEYGPVYWDVAVQNIEAFIKNEIEIEEYIGNGYSGKAHMLSLNDWGATFGGSGPLLKNGVKIGFIE